MSELSDNLSNEVEKIMARKDFDNASEQLGEAARELRHSQVELLNQLQFHASAITRHAQTLDSLCHILIKALKDWK